MRFNLEKYRLENPQANNLDQIFNGKYKNAERVIKDNQLDKSLQFSLKAKMTSENCK